MAKKDSYNNYSKFEGQALDLLGLKGWAGPAHALPGEEEFDIVISPNQYRLSHYVSPELGLKLPHVVALDWPDMDVPQGLSKGFWDRLRHVIEANEYRTAVMCAGGKGRTGTTLCILLGHKTKGKTAAEVIEVIRALYCNEAVETKSQQEYVAKMLDLPVGDSVIHASKYGLSAMTTANIGFRLCTSPKISFAELFKTEEEQIRLKGKPVEDFSYLNEGLGGYVTKAGGFWSGPYKDLVSAMAYHGGKWEEKKPGNFVYVTDTFTSAVFTKDQLVKAAVQ